MDGWMEWGEDEDDDDLFSQSISVCMYALARSLARLLVSSLLSVVLPRVPPSWYLPYSNSIL